VSSFDRSDFLYVITVLSGALVAVLLFLATLLVVLSPGISVDIPGVGRCKGAECIGGRGGD
jgi:hypothetical protein